MRRETQNVVLVLLGGALVKIALDGTYLRYVKASLQPWLLATGVVVVGLAVLAIVRDVRRAAPADPHDHHGSRSPWMLVLPVLAIFLVAPPALGASSVDTSTSARSVAESVGSQRFPSLPDTPAPAVRMVDFVQRAVWDTDGSLLGREVTLTGFTVRGDAGGTELARLVIGCCAADALPVRVVLDAGQRQAEVDALGEDSWLAVRLELVAGSATASNGYVPTATVRSWTAVAAPEQEYES